MSYIKDELGLINALIKSKNIGALDKELLNRAVKYFSLVIKEKNILAKRDGLEKMVIGLTELVDDKLLELHLKKRTAVNEDEIRRINEVVEELENLKQTIVDNNKIYIETIIANLDSVLDGQTLLNECAEIICKSNNTELDPNIFTKGNVNELFNDVYEKAELLSFIKRREDTEKKLDGIIESETDKTRLVHIINLCQDNFIMIEEFINLISAQLKLKDQKDGLLKTLSEVDIELTKLENARFKFHKKESRVAFLHSKIRRINESVLELNEENAKINEYINALHKTLKIIGLGEVAHIIRYSNKTFDNNLNEIVSPLYDLRMDEKENIFAVENLMDIVLLLIEQVNNNNRNNITGDTTLIRIINGGNKSNEYPEIVTNLELSHIERKLLDSVMKYLNNITIVDGKLVIDGSDEISVTSSAIATLLLKVIIDINGDVLLEDLPEYIKVKSNMHEIEVWYKDYIESMYDETVLSIETISNEKGQSLNKTI